MAKTIVVTAGHSNTDSGAVGSGITESSFATSFRNALASKLRLAGYNVLTDGVGSDNKDLKHAIRLAKLGDFAIETHLNAFSNNTAKGVETIGLAKDKVICQEISAAVASITGTTVRGDNGYITQEQSHRGSLGFVNAGGVILELEFISNPARMTTLQLRYWLVAQAVADVIIKHIK